MAKNQNQTFLLRPLEDFPKIFLGRLDFNPAACPGGWGLG